MAQMASVIQGNSGSPRMDTTPSARHAPPMVLVSAAASLSSMPLGDKEQDGTSRHLDNPEQFDERVDPING